MKTLFDDKRIQLAKNMYYKEFHASSKSKQPIPEDVLEEYKTVVYVESVKKFYEDFSKMAIDAPDDLAFLCAKKFAERQPIYECKCDKCIDCPTMGNTNITHLCTNKCKCKGHPIWYKNGRCTVLPSL